MLRVLHIIYDDPKNPWLAGGGAVRVFEIYRRLAPRLGAITVITGAFPGAVDEEIEGIQYRRLGATRPYYWSRATFAWRASRELARGDFDVAVFDFSTYLPLRIPPAAPIGITVHHVTGPSAPERWGRAVGWWVAEQERRRLRRARTFSATSGITERRLRAIVGPAAQIHRIGAGVPDALFEIERRDSDYLLYFGRLDWFQKGLDVLLEAMRMLIQTQPHLRLKVAGRGKDAARFEAAAASLGIGRNVEFLGAVGDAERNGLFSGASVLLMPSRFEGFGMVAAEAMAAGIPVIASDADSLPEVIDPPRGGVLVPAGDPQALADAARHLLSDPVTRQELSASARISAERFRWDHVAEEHLAFLEAIERANRR